MVGSSDLVGDQPVSLAAVLQLDVRDVVDAAWVERDGVADLGGIAVALLRTLRAPLLEGAASGQCGRPVRVRREAHPRTPTGLQITADAEDRAVRVFTAVPGLPLDGEAVPARSHLGVGGGPHALDHGGYPQHGAAHPELGRFGLPVSAQHDSRGSAQVPSPASSGYTSRRACISLSRCAQHL